MVDFCCPRQANRKTPLAVAKVWSGMLAAIVLGKQRPSYHIGIAQLPIVGECFWKKFKMGWIKETYDDSGQVGR